MLYCMSQNNVCIKALYVSQRLAELLRKLLTARALAADVSGMHLCKLHTRTDTHRLTDTRTHAQAHTPTHARGHLVQSF